MNLLYVGTASYDDVVSRERQTSEFVKLGVSISSLDVANNIDVANYDDMREAVYSADIVLVGGGNTLYALDRWDRVGLSDLLRDAARRGTVMAGGSAGAICWFDGGHSDSMDPATHRRAYRPRNAVGGRSRDGDCDYDSSSIESIDRVQNDDEDQESGISNDPSHDDGGRGAATATGHGGTGKDEDATTTTATMTTTTRRRPSPKRTISLDETSMVIDAEGDGVIADEDVVGRAATATSDWEYIRVGGLGIFPGLVCPHHDCIQSNGVLRSSDFSSMMAARYPHEIGIGIDNHAALVFDGDEYRVLSMPGVSNSRIRHEVGKVPGVWIHRVDDDGIVRTARCPRVGRVSDLLQALRDPAAHPRHDERVELCRRKNPQPEGIFSKM